MKVGLSMFLFNFTLIMFLRSSILRLNRGTAAGGWLSRSVARNVAAMSTETAASGNVPDRQVIKRFYKEVTVVKEDGEECAREKSVRACTEKGFSRSVKIEDRWRSISDSP